MKKSLTTLSILFISLAFIAPVQVSAATNAGVKPGSFFYFFDTASEKINLFFTFGGENKAKKALEYADERLAEAEESANENNLKAVEKAIVGYKEEISLATEKSKGLKDQNKVEELLNTVSENTAKHQEVLAGVLEKVPEEAKQAILNAIEVSKKGQEEAVKQVAEFKGEVEKLKKEVEELKAKNEAQTKETEETKKQKSENTSAPAKSSVSSFFETTKTTKPAISVQSQTPTKTEETKSAKIITLPNGAVVEMDENGSILRTIKEAPQKPYIAPTKTIQNQVPTTQKVLITVSAQMGYGVGYGDLADAQLSIENTSDYPLVVKGVVFSFDNLEYNANSTMKIDGKYGVYLTEKNIGTLFNGGNSKLIKISFDQNISLQPWQDDNLVIQLRKIQNPNSIIVSAQNIIADSIHGDVNVLGLPSSTSVKRPQ